MANIRLRDYNGIHLAFVVQRDAISTRTILFAEERDLWAAPIARAANAFFELTPRILVALPAYATASLPAIDRRDPGKFDRRSLPRGGRRLFDQQLLSAATLA